MALFNRNKQSTANLPPEVQQYYAAERRDRSWLAWLLAIASLAVVVLLFIGVFFGVRWLYDRAHNKNKGNQTATTSSKNSGSSNSGSANGSNGSSNSGTPPTTSTPSPAPTPTPTPAPAATPAPSTTTTPTKPTTQPSNLTNTGPGDVIAIFIATTAVAAIGHTLYTRRKLQR